MVLDSLNLPEPSRPGPVGRACPLNTQISNPVWDCPCRWLRPKVQPYNGSQSCCLICSDFLSRMLSIVPSLLCSFIQLWNYPPLSIHTSCWPFIYDESFRRNPELSLPQSCLDCLRLTGCLKDVGIINRNTGSTSSYSEHRQTVTDLDVLQDYTSCLPHWT